jgi:hypothetical protein
MTETPVGVFPPFSQTAFLRTDLRSCRHLAPGITGVQRYVWKSQEGVDPNDLTFHPLDNPTPVLEVERTGVNPLLFPRRQVVAWAIRGQPALVGAADPTNTQTLRAGW